MCRSSVRPTSREAQLLLRRVVVIASVLGALLMLVLRARSPALAPPSVAPPAALDVELSGCAAVLAGPVCELAADGTLRVWVRAAPGAVTFDTPSGAVVTTELAELQGGTLYRVAIPTGAPVIRVRSHAGALRSVRLAPRSAPPWVERAKALRQSGDAPGAALLVATAETSHDDVERAFALGLRARLELSAGRTEASFPLFREAVRLHRAHGRISDAADDSFALAFAYNQRSHRYAEARGVLDDIRAGDLTAYPDGGAREAYYRGTLATETGDARAALQHLPEARDHAARLGLALLERNAINAHALQLELVGRVREALDMLAELERRVATAGDVAACEKAEIAINTGFGALLAEEERDELGAERFDAVAPLERAVALCQRDCNDRYLRAAALGNLALAALQRGEASKARMHLEAARAGVTDARGIEVLFWHDLEGRIALAEGETARALTAFDEEVRRARSTLSFEAEWRAHVGKGTGLERTGRNAPAVEEYRAAEELLTSTSLLVPMGEGRGTFVGARSRSAKAAVDLLVRMGRAEEALAVVRSSRARVVAGLAQRARLEGSSNDDRARWEKALGAFRTARAALDTEAKDDWKLPRAEAARARGARDGREAELRAALDATFAVFASAGRAREGARLPALPRDATTLAFHPVRSGWVGIVADSSGVTTFPITSLPPTADGPALSERLLAPLGVRLERATRLRVLPFGALRAVDFHALPYEGKPLAMKLLVEYPVDLPARARNPVEEPRRALVISDPTLDLTGTRAETDHVVRAIRERGSYRVDVLEGPQATSAAILPLLARAALLHYAGHGVFAGREGWQSALPLAGGGHLAIGDVLAANDVPERVVLLGCETARTSTATGEEGLGLAQAFVVAGADVVIAPVRPVDDALAAHLSRALYGALAQSGVVDAATALRDAQMRIVTEDPALDWSAFRVSCR